MEMRLPSVLGLLSLLLVLAAQQASAASWDEERLRWLVVTKPGELQAWLNCSSEYIYPFLLLNDSSIIGAVNSPVKRIWWLLPDGRRVNDTYKDGNRQVLDNGVALFVNKVDDSVSGLYHCAAEAITRINDTNFDYNRTTVYYYKRGLNLYGMDLYGGNTWEKYKRNTLIGSLTAGVFLAMVAGYALLDRFGVFAKCAGRSNTVDALGGGGGEVGGVDKPDAAAAAAPAAEEMTDAPRELPAYSTEHSRASVRSRRAEQQAQETAA